MLPGSPNRPKDFALVRSDGIYHVFFIINTSSTPASKNEVRLGHATSPDLYHWTQEPAVMQSEAESWNNSHVWAPSIVYKDGLWWMLYTGTTLVAGQYNDTQRMGLAVSEDLYRWSRVEQPVFAAPQVPWTWVDSLNSWPAFRDPYVMPDPTLPGSYLMYYTASYGPDSLADVVGIARSNGDFTSWTDVGPLLITWRGYTYNQVTESPHLFQHNGLWYLVLTTSSGQPLSLYTATDPLAGPSGWVYRGRLRNMLGVDTSTWFASECVRFGTHDIFAFATGDRLEFREIEWGSGWSFALVQPRYYNLHSLEWAQTTVRDAEPARLVVRAANAYAGAPLLQAFVVDSLGAETAVPAESLGFDDAPVLAADVDTLTWLARRWPRVPDRDTLTETRVRIRAADSTAASGLLVVRAPLTRFNSFVPGDSTGDPSDPPDEPVLKPVLRTLLRSPAGDAPAAVVSLPAAAAARVDLFDVLGRRVRTLAARELPRGVTVLPWDGRDETGRPQERGVYFVRLSAGAQVRTARLLLLAR